MTQDFPELPRVEFAFPGPLRNRLVAAILSGSKTSTTSLAREYTIEGEPFPVPGAHQVVVDSEGRPIAVIEITDVAHVRLGDVPWEHARDEGEGHVSVGDWRRAHERFWRGENLRTGVEDPECEVDDDTIVILERFSVVKRLTA
ncbi:MAG: RNA-binding protein [Glaciihabitans sp.]|nr:RNA-binding protein [Glaciihabitans sp.]